jgi:hypothetical protein
MRRSLIRCGVLTGAVVLGACDLAVINPNQPETARVLATAADVEALLGTQYLRAQGSLYGGTGNVWGMAAVQSHEDFSSLSNNCLGQRVSIPRPPNDNSIGNGCRGDQRSVYYTMSEVMRTASNVLAKFKDDGNPATVDFTLGGQAQDLRAKAFAEFIRGYAMAYIALVYDSAAVISEEMSTQDPGTLIGYTNVMDSALAGFDRALVHANTAITGNAAQGFPLPSTWIPSPTAVSLAEFNRVVRSYRARFRANLPRTPAERDAVDWPAVIADAQNGFTADHLNNTGANTGGASNGWVAQWLSFTTWHQMTPFIVGMGDGADGAYQAWISQPLDARGTSATYVQVSPDLRWPQGADRSAQQTDFALTSCSSAGAVCKRYFVNRPTGNDSNSPPSWGWSNYDWVRSYPWRQFGGAAGFTGQQGPLVFFRKQELNLLEAEGHYRAGNYAAAAALINLTRTAATAGLPQITIFDATSDVPGLAACVPKMSVLASPAGGGTVKCGNLWEALKYEKRMETMYTAFASMFFDSRGWGDLAEGTPLDWAPPYEDLQARGYPNSKIYSTGGAGATYHSAPKGTYGW